MGGMMHTRMTPMIENNIMGEFEEQVMMDIIQWAKQYYGNMVSAPITPQIINHYWETKLK